ncbi:MAG: 2-amino-4-hydroxy-6-hydroxymethyldihydropteridine diphosphokinase [Paracoccus sp. (in: a-proteobacteria)]
MLETIAETRMYRKLALIALGANLSSLAGSPSESLLFALRLFCDIDGAELHAVSRFYETPAFPPGSGPDYVNACAALKTELEAEALLAELHAIESRLGRSRDNGRWGARGIDLDLLAVAGEVFPNEVVQNTWRALPFDQQMQREPDQLILPHPRLQDRAFVLVPLADIAPGWRHPRIGLSVAQMLAALPAADRESVQIILDKPGQSGHEFASPLT